MKHPEWRPKTEVEALGHLIEEAGEVLQMAGRLVRFCMRPDGSVEGGWTGPDGLNNLQRLAQELTDLEIAAQRVREIVYGETPTLHFPELQFEGDEGQDVDLAKWRAEVVTSPGGTVTGTWWCTCPGGGALNALAPATGRCALCNRTIVKFAGAS